MEADEVPKASVVERLIELVEWIAAIAPVLPTR
jgi:hypothetical protein